MDCLFPWENPNLKWMMSGDTPMTKRKPPNMYSTLFFFRGYTLMFLPILSQKRPPRSAKLQGEGSPETETTRTGAASNDQCSRSASGVNTASNGVLILSWNGLTESLGFFWRSGILLLP